MYKILVIDDEIENTKLVKQYGEHLNHQVDCINEPEHVLHHLQSNVYDIILLDIMMPTISGYDLIKDIKQLSSAKIIFLSALSETADRIKGLKLGSNDYFTKPFSLEELFLKIDILLKTKQTSQNQLINGIRFDTINHTVVIGDEVIKLTNILYKLMFELVSHRNECLSREYLLSSVWGITTSSYNRTVDTHILKLRTLLGVHSYKIVTITKKGYMYED